MRLLKGLLRRRSTQLKPTGGKKRLGIAGEKLAQKYLRRKRFRIRALNYQSPHGEIDIVAQEKNTIVFVEVRTLSTDKYGSPFDVLKEEKKHHLTRAAKHYLGRFHLEHYDWRFDFISVIMGEKRRHAKFEHIEDAFPPRRRPPFRR